MMHHHLALLIIEGRREVRCRMKKMVCQIVAISKRGFECRGVMHLTAHEAFFHIVS